MIVHGPQVGRWVAEQTGGAWHGQGAGLGVVRGDRVLSGVLVESYNGASCLAHIACSVAHREFVDLIRVAFRYMFDQLKVNVIIGRVAETNVKCRALVARLGFVEACRIEGGCVDGALVIYTVKRDECRYL